MYVSGSSSRTKSAAVLPSSKIHVFRLFLGILLKASVEVCNSMQRIKILVYAVQLSWLFLQPFKLKPKPYWSLVHIMDLCRLLIGISRERYCGSEMAVMNREWNWRKHCSSHDSSPCDYLSKLGCLSLTHCYFYNYASVHLWEGDST